MIIAHTSVIIDHLRQTKSKDSFLMKLARKKPKETLGISIISIQELYEGQSTKDDLKEQFLLATVSPLKILPYTYEVAKLAGEIARDLKRPIELADAAIAATSIVNNASLFTLNQKDFRGIKPLAMFKE